jgi:hypothetical protein
MAASHSFSVILEPQQGGGFTVLVPVLHPDRISGLPRRLIRRSGKLFESAISAFFNVLFRIAQHASR